MTLRFEQPTLLFLGLLALPLLWIGLRTLAHVEPVRRWTILLLRTFLVVLIAAMLAGPHAVQEHNQIAVVALVDVSGSVRRFAQLPPVPDQPGATNIDSFRYWMHASVDRNPGDRFGIIAFDGQAIATSAPSRGPWVDDNLDLPMMDGTNIAEAIRLGLAMLPADTARRLVLISDGNQTSGDALEAARQAAAAGEHGSGVPIDIVPIDFRIENDVQIVRVEAPPTAQPGQTITVRIIMQSVQPTTGNLTLRREGEPVDLSPGQPGHMRRISVPAGQSVHLAQVTLGHTPVNRFEAIFEPADPAQDALTENNRAEAFTATPSRGSVLVLTNQADDRHGLADMLRQADIPASVATPQMLAADLLSLQNYDLIVLDNVPGFDFTPLQQQLLAHYVDRLGGGLIMIGGDRSFGAGAWVRTPVADILPVELDPPRELRSPSAALVLVLDRSGSMNRPVAGARATQQEVANEAAALAVESLQAETYIGVVVFDHTNQMLVPMRLNDHPEEIVRELRSITPAGGTLIEPALRRAHDMIQELPDVQHKHIVLLTDGISADPDMESFIELAAGDGVKITTVGVGDAIDQDQLFQIADGTGGVFHHVRNPRTLPRILVDTVQEFNKPLIKEGLFQPVVRPTGSPLTVGMEVVPPLSGIVITAPRDDRTVLLDMIHPEGEPLLAHWQAGLGRVAAFTSDFDGPWSRQWRDFPGAQAFWTQLVRTISRPAVSRETELITIIRDDQLHITLEAADEQEGFLDYLQVEGTVYLPDGHMQQVRLRQSAPGRYEASILATQAGSYIVALSPRHGQRQLTPVIGGASRATSEEFRRYESDLGLLREIAQMTGGRELSIHEPQLANLFDRRGMPSSASLLPAWQRILWWVIALLLLDVASRRIAWDWPLVRRGLLAAIEKVTPARVKGERSLATLGGLQQASTRVDMKWSRESQGVEKLQGTGTIAPPPVRQRATSEPQRSAPAKPAQKTPTDEGRVRAALDAFLGRTPEPPKPDAPQTSQATGKDEDGKDTPPPTRSSLLEAKRRVREQMNRDQK